MKSIINFEEISKNEPMFFGKDMGLQRYDVFAHPRIFTMYKNQIGFMWRPEEINLDGKERLSYESLSETERFVFTKNLFYQIILDSVQSRGIDLLLKHCSNLEVEAFAKWWGAFENLHSYSYTYIIKAVYPNPSIIFDDITNDLEVKERAISVTKYYNDLIDEIPEDSLDDKKKKLYLALMSVNILEGIRFYVSFACSYAMAENSKMEGAASIISLINRDENLHLGFTQYILNQMRKDPKEGFQHIVEECEPIVIEMFKNAAEEEIRWAEYLFSKGSILGLNTEILSDYMKWLTNSRMNAIKLKPIFPKVDNPIPWILNWTESKGVQEAPQEIEKISYVVGNYKQDLDKGFDNFSF